MTMSPQTQSDLSFLPEQIGLRVMELYGATGDVYEICHRFESCLTRETYHQLLRWADGQACEAPRQQRWWRQGSAVVG